MSAPQALVNYSPRELLETMAGAMHSVPKDLQKIVLFFAYEPFPHEMIMCARYSCYAQSVEARVEYQRCSLVYASVSTLFKSLQAFGREFNCADFVENCIRYVAQTTYRCQTPLSNRVQQLDSVKDYQKKMAIWDLHLGSDVAAKAAAQNADQTQKEMAALFQALRVEDKVKPDSRILLVKLDQVQNVMRSN